MAAASIFFADQLRCSVCLQVFTDPISAPCGHNFCRTCIAAPGHRWATGGDWGHRCPVCGETLDEDQTRRVNTGLRDLAELFKTARINAGENIEGSFPLTGPLAPAIPGEVLCDFCLGTKLKAHKSCLVCLASYCQLHLEPHGRVQALKKHQLIGPVGNLEDRVCWKHNVSVGFFCRTDRTCVCAVCLRDDHGTHDTVSFEEELASRRAQLDGLDAAVKRQLQDNLRRVEEVKRSVTQSRKESKRAIEAMADAFAALVASVKASHAELVNAMECRQRSLEAKSQGFIADLEVEMAELRRGSKEIEQLSNTEDDLLLLLRNPFPPLVPTQSPPGEIPEVFLRRDQIVDVVTRGITQQKEAFSKDMKRVAQEIKLPGTDAGKRAEKEMKVCLGKKTERLFEDQLMRIQKLYSVDVTLDPDTANPFLVVTKDRKQVRDEAVQRYFPNNQKRFTVFKYVTGKEGFSSSLYYEAHVSDLTYWDVGVVIESIIGNEQNITASQKSWSVCLIQGYYYANSKPPTNIRLSQKPQKIGVFVDYEACQVSFYNVDNRTLIYCFTGCLFKQGSHRLFPLIGVSKTTDKMFSSTLTITPVNCGNSTVFQNV